MDNKERFINFVKGFGSVALTIITLIACVGSLNYGIELGQYFYAGVGAIGMCWCIWLTKRYIEKN